MGSRIDLHPVEGVGNELFIVLNGRLQLDSSGQQVLSTALGTKTFGFTAARTSAGIYTLTLANRWLALYSCDVQTLVAGATPANRGGSWKVDSAVVNPPLGSQGTVVIRNELAPLAGSAGVAVDPPNRAILLVSLTLSRGKI